MKITRQKLTEIIKEELQREFTLAGPEKPACQGVEPDGAELSEAISQLENARAIVARAYPELLEELDYVVTKMKSVAGAPPQADPYKVGGPY